MAELVASRASLRTLGLRVWTSLLWRSRPLLNRVGWELAPLMTAETDERLPPDFEQEDETLYTLVSPYTMTPPERIYALRRAVEYVVRNSVVGEFVECGVWRGGSMMAMASTLISLGQADRDLYLFDTYSGMPAPRPEDVMYTGAGASELMADAQPGSRLKADASLEDVQTNLSRIAYPGHRLHFVEGRVEETIPDLAPAQISLLRLDTDWYESTKHSLEQLYPRLSPGGVLIIDDYGHWQGARKAVDDYFAEHDLRLLLNRVDYACRLALKP